MEKIDTYTLATQVSDEDYLNMSALGALSPNYVKKVLAKGDLLRMTKGETLFKSGEKADCFFIVLRGRVKIYLNEGKTKKVYRITDIGESLGFASMLGLRPRVCNAVIDTDCIVLRIGGLSFADLYKEDIHEFAILFMNLSRDMSRFLHQVTEDRIEKGDEGI